MSETMVERVARAIYEERGNSYAHRTFDANGKAYGKWFAALSSARAAIEAMREADAAMLHAGMADVGWGDCEESEMLFRWRSMIDAALSEGEQG